MGGLCISSQMAPSDVGLGGDRGHHEKKQVTATGTGEGNTRGRVGA